MLEPVQNCFTFYHPDGKSSAHTYSELDAFIEDKKNNLPQEEFNVAQQCLALSKNNPTSKN